MAEHIKPYPDSSDSKARQVEQMFDNISGRYDFLNRFLSLGIDVYWRKRAIALLRKENPKHILDVATGTADLALEAWSIKPDKITGVDISEGMLSHGRKKIQARGLSENITLIKADASNLPFQDHYFDAAMVAFGVRNFENLKNGLTEMRRTLRPGGRIVVLEFSKPRMFPFKQLFQFYFRYILPAIGKTVSKDARAYTYLPDSVAAFPEGKDFLTILEQCGYQKPQEKRLTFGVCALYTAIA